MKNKFPKINLSKENGEIGISIIESTIKEKFKWIFRRNFIDFDFGIDGYIDLVTDEGYVTGKSIAIQVKCGHSFFKSQNRIGWVYYGESKHLNYLLNIEIPILILIVNPDNREIYFTEFSIKNCEESGDNWKTTIPFVNKLDYKFKEYVLDLTNPVTDYIFTGSSLKRSVTSAYIFVVLDYMLKQPQYLYL